jgi:2-polyprenyl-6-methoxyphenol hydroxylase-like FAD-dependent oxidoreductase
MEAVVADKMIDCSEKPQIFLAGDSAHAFPPSGGFGLNTGIGDAHNISHKLAFALQTGNMDDLK